MARPSRRLLALAVATRLSGITPVTLGYFGQIGRPLTSPAPAGWVTDPPPKSADDQRVQPYLILFPGAGTDGPDQDLADTATDLTAPWTVTCAAGDIEDLLALLDRVDARLNRWIPAITGATCGPVHPLPGYNPGPTPLVDQQFTPGRLYVPLQYQTIATT